MPAEMDRFDGIDLRSEDFGSRFDEITQHLVRRCPVAHTQSGWLVTRYGDVHAALSQWQTFSSGTEMGVSVWRPKDKKNYKPNEIDPPLHTKFRRPFQRMFAPGPIRELEPSMRSLARDLIQSFKEAGGGEVVNDFVRPFVGIFFFRYILGLPMDEASCFTDLVHEMLNGPLELMDDAYDRYIKRIDAVMRSQSAGTASEFVATVLDLEIDGEPISWEDRIAIMGVFIIGGLDTTVFATASLLHHLSTNPEDRERLTGDPGLLPDAIEEALRRWSPAWVLGRTAMVDVEISGQRIPAGDRVLLSFGIANRDPSKYQDPLVFKLDRGAHNHMAFGIGPHRCIGSHLARTEIRVAVEEFLTAIPHFIQRAGTEAEWTTTTVRGVCRCYIDVVEP